MSSWQTVLRIQPWGQEFGDKKAKWDGVTGTPHLLVDLLTEWYAQIQLSDTFPF